MSSLGAEEGAPSLDETVLLPSSGLPYHPPVHGSLASAGYASLPSRPSAGPGPCAFSNRHGEQVGHCDRKGVLVSTPLILSMVPLGFAQNYSDLAPLTGSMIAGQVMDFDVARGSRGEIVVVYSRENATGGMTISLARMDAGVGAMYRSKVLV